MFLHCVDCKSRVRSDLMWIDDDGSRCDECKKKKYHSPGEAKEFCWHEWREYVGFTDIYAYCAKCDVKDHNWGRRC